ncbi:MAG: GntR family transcriptional regulator [Alphaproteobacteria bacterium]|nr:GntR family transcriptional regulator [Alphaproteobacteria bacterium]
MSPQSEPLPLAGIAVPSLPDIAYAHLRRDILAGVLAPGAPLRQEEIAAGLAISRLPVREALARLDSEGLAMLRPRRGYVVADLDPEDIVDLFDIRAMLEERAGRLATGRRTDGDVAAVAAILADIDRIDAAGGLDVAAFAERNQAFHERLFAPCGRRRLLRLLFTLRDQVESYARMSASVAGSLGHAQAEHRAILDAFRDGDADTVGLLCRRHVEGIGARLVEALADRGR